MNPPTSTLLLASGAIGAVFGFVTHRSHFCTMGAVSDIVTMGDWTRLRVWALSIAIIMAGLHGGQAALGWDPAPSHYLSNRLLWLSHGLGGFLFGIGMVLASGCGSKTLVRVGSGNLKSLVVLITMSVTALMSLKGLLALPRVHVLNSLDIEFAHAASLPAWLQAIGLPALSQAAPWVLSGALALWALWSGSMRRWQPIATAVGLGTAVLGMWYLALDAGFVAEDPDTLQARYLGSYANRPEAMTFTAPLAHTLEWLAYFSDSNRHITLGVACVLGVLLGAWGSARLQGRLRIEAFRQAEDLKRHLLGATLMGFGGVLGMGCSIGQGFSGVSTLSLGSWITLAAMLAGAAWRLRRDYALAGV